MAQKAHATMPLALARQSLPAFRQLMRAFFGGEEDALQGRVEAVTAALNNAMGPAQAAFLEYLHDYNAKAIASGQPVYTLTQGPTLGHSIEPGDPATIQMPPNIVQQAIQWKMAQLQASGQTDWQWAGRPEKKKETQQNRHDNDR